MFIVLGLLTLLTGVVLAWLSRRVPRTVGMLEIGAGFLLICGLSLSSCALPYISSSLATPMSWKAASVNAQPLWQTAQFALPLKSAKPRLAAAFIAAALPWIQRSKGASVDTIERSKVAKDCSILSRVTSPLPKA